MNQHASARGRLKQGFLISGFLKQLNIFWVLHSMQMKNSGVQASLHQNPILGLKGSVQH